MLRTRDREILVAFLPFWSYVVFFMMDLLTLSSPLDGPGLSRGRPRWGPQGTLDAPQPLYPMDLEPLQEGEVKQWAKDTVILLVGDEGLWGTQGGGLEPEVLIKLGAGTKAP